MSSPLTLKLLLVTIFIGLVSLAGKRWGPTVAGWLAGLPVVSGPILFILWLEHGEKFARDAAVYSLAAVAPGMVFAVVYARASRRWGWPLTAAVAYGAWSLAALAILMLPIGVVSAALLAIGALFIGPRAFPRQPAGPIMVRPSKFDIEFRMLAGVVLTLFVTSLADVSSTRVSGVLSMFPVISGVLAVFIHRYDGTDAALAALRGLPRGFWSLAAFCAALAIDPTPRAGFAFGAATAIAIGIQALLPRH